MLMGKRRLRSQHVINFAAAAYFRYAYDLVAITVLNCNTHSGLAVALLLRPL